MKKYLCIFISIFMLLFTTTVVSADEVTEDIIGVFTNEIESLNEMYSNEAESLIENLHTNISEEVREELISDIFINTILSKADFNLKNFYVSGNNFRAVIEVSHQGNIKNFLNYRSRINDTKDYYLQREEAFPLDLEVSCLNETLELLQDKKTKVDLELECTFENGVPEIKPLSFSNKLKIFKSMFF